VNGSQLPIGTAAGQSGAGNYQQGTTVTISAGTRSGFNFAGWTVNADGVTLANANSAATTFVMPTNAVTVTANWTPASGTLTPQPDGVIFLFHSGNNGFPSFSNPWHGDNPGFWIEFTPNVSFDWIIFQWLRSGTPFGSPIDSRNIHSPSNRVRLNLFNVNPWNHNGIWTLRATTYVNGVAAFVDHSRAMELFVTENTSVHVSTPAPIPTPVPTPPPAPVQINVPSPQVQIPASAPVQPRPATTPSAPPAPLEPIIPTRPINIVTMMNSRTANFNQPSVLTYEGTLIPVREVFARLGYSIEWDAGTRSATLTRGRSVIIITEGSHRFSHNGFMRNHNGNQEAQMINGHLMVPFLQVLTAAGARAWRDADNVLHIVHP
jgi:uncharacterized repeat protein (TIGR02543 family)